MSYNTKDTLIPDVLFSVLVTAFLKIGFKYSDNDILEVNEFSIDNENSNDFSNAYENYNLTVNALFSARDYTQKISKDNTLINYLRKNNFIIDSKNAVRREEDAKIIMTLSLRSSICLNY